MSFGNGTHSTFTSSDVGFLLTIFADNSRHEESPLTGWSEVTCKVALIGDNPVEN